MMRARTVLVSAGAAAAVLSGATLWAADNGASVAEVGPAVFRPVTPPAAAPKRSDLVFAATRLPAQARHDLGELTPAERAELAAPDRRTDGGVRPKKPAVKVGISRALPEPVGFSGLPSDLLPGQVRSVSGGAIERTPDGGLAWTASFASAGAGALRLHLRQASLPAGSRVYVYGEASEIQGPYDFASGTRPEGFWTNTIFADRIFLEVRIPASATPAELARAALAVASVVHLKDQAGATLRPKSDACFVDRSCVTPSEFPNIDQASRAIAQINFDDQGGHYACTAGLLNTTSGSSVPYVLTANHCFSTQASATSLEAFWQYRTATCNGARPDEDLFPRTLGSTLLATGDAATSSDFTFVQLSQDPPANSVLLGWTTADLLGAAGLVLYRVSNPVDVNHLAMPQVFTREQIISVSDGDTCSDAPASRFLYEKDIQGGTGGGSSGSPAMLEDLRVVGQEFGSCGTNTDDNCDVVNNDSIDGAFSVTYSSIRQWLQPGSPGPCVSNATTLCLDNARFRVTVFYATSQGTSGAGMGVPLTGDSGYFWFFGPDNIELVVKVLTGCGINQKFWVFAGGLTNVGVTLLVEDTVTGTSRTYTNAVGSPYQPLQDTQAFSCP